MVAIHICPYCNNPGISSFRKLFVGPPRGTATCKRCGKKVGVPNYAAITYIPIVLLVFFSLFDYMSIIFSWILFIFTTIIINIIYIKWIPLIPK